MVRGRVLVLALAAAGCDRFERAPRGVGYDMDDRSYLTILDQEGKPRRERAPDRPAAKHRIHAKARFVWIRPRPSETDDYLGYLTLGQSVAVRGTERDFARGDERCDAWAPVEPRGWVCLGREATLDGRDPIVLALQPYAAKTSLPWPFDYARSLDAPRYRKLPTADDQERREASHLGRVERAKRAENEAQIRAIDANLVGVDLGPTGELPPPHLEAAVSILEGDDDVPYGSTVAYGYEFDHGGRPFVLTSDHAIVPLSRLRRFPRSDFRGIELGGDATLPVAFTRARPRTAHALTGREKTEDGARLLETRAGAWLAERDVIVIRREAETPRHLNAAGRRTWIEVSTLGGWLAAYEGEEPVFATLISAGRGDAKPGGGMVDLSSTPNGTFSIRSKLKTTTMRSEYRPDTSHAEVMYTQVFKDAFALHGAYWHDDFGDRKSAGCVNLSPIDSQWLFAWSEPTVPADWHAATTRRGDAATIVVIHP